MTSERKRLAGSLKSIVNWQYMRDVLSIVLMDDYRVENVSGREDLINMSFVAYEIRNLIIVNALMRTLQ